MNLNNIKILLQDISEFEILEIIDNSDKHMGHAGVENTSTMWDRLVEISLINTLWSHAGGHVLYQ